MQIQHEEESRLRALKCEAEVEVLKEEIASAFALFSGGTIGARELLVRTKTTSLKSTWHAIISDQTGEKQL